MKGKFMSSGMNVEEAKKVAEKMTFRQAVENCMCARCVPFRKATRIKMQELLCLVGCIEQIKFERDVAIEQLHELGYELGEKIQ